MTQPSKRRRFARLALYIGILGSIATVLLASRVSAGLSEQSLKLGQNLDQFAALSGSVTQLNWNGQRFSVSTRVLHEPIERALGRFVVLCSQGTEELATELTAQLGPSPGIFQRLLVLRDRPTEDTGTGVCLAGIGEAGLSGLVERVKTFASSWDLSDLGQLRYTFIRKINAATTHVILVSADGPLVLPELVPLDGQDVAGPEVVPGARPHHATRIVAAAASGTAHVLNAYHVAADANAALADYGTQLETLGYQALRLQDHQTIEVTHNVLSRTYTRNQHTLVATAQPDAQGSLLAVVQLDPQTAKAAR
ncbi:MAG TPA: hypothetical protein VFN67_37865 [Polyangiales bacterium]|nr:hypothetical protein [Polyangiales bacterium]